MARLTQEQRDRLIDDATHAAEDAFAQRGVVLLWEHLVALNDFLATILREVLPE